MDGNNESGARPWALVILTVAMVVTSALAWWGQPPIVQAAVAFFGIAGAWLAYWIGGGKKEEAAQTTDAATNAPPPLMDEIGENACLPDPAREKSLILSGELSAAHEIQMRLVPHTFPPLPGYPLFDLFALIEPAREIGGDFYDFWMLGRERLALVIADVSGKGVPAAIFMAMARTYLRAFSRHIHDPAQLLERLNREVARNNPGCMFVTVFCGIVDLATGRMDYSNAGHNPPMRKKPGEEARIFDIDGQPPVGFIGGYKYASQSTILEPGEMLLLYTDGLNEALDSEGREFGEEQARLCFSEAADSVNLCRAVVMQIRSHLAEHVGGAEQYDDITIMAYRQPEAVAGWDASGTDAEADATAGDSALASFSSTSQSMLLSDGGDCNNRFFSLSDLKNRKE